MIAEAESATSGDRSDSSRTRSRSQSRPGPAEGPSDVANAASGGKGKGKSKSQQSKGQGKGQSQAAEITCFNCNKPGHRVRDCREPKKTSKGSESSNVATGVVKIEGGDADHMSRVRQGNQWLTDKQFNSNTQLRIEELIHCGHHEGSVRKFYAEEYEPDAI